MLEVTHMADILLLQTALCRFNIELTLAWKIRLTSVPWTQPNWSSMNLKYILLVEKT